MANLIKKLLARKILFGTIVLALIASGYFGYTKIFSNNGAIRYATAAVEKGTLIVSISGSGQVAVLNQADVKPKASGEIVAVYVKPGQNVAAGATLAQLDASDAARTVRDAETALETAKLELDKMLQPIDELTLLQAQNSLTDAKDSKQKAEDNIIKAYEDGFNTVSNAFLDLPGIMAGLENTLFGKTIDSTQDNITWYINQTSIQNDERDKAIRYENDVYTAYNKARLAYTKNFDSYKSASRTSSNETIEELISETYDTTQLIAEAIKATDNYIDFIQDAMELRHYPIPSAVSTQQSNISTYTGKTNGHLINLLSLQRTLKDSREAVVSADKTIRERELSLAKTTKGPDDLDVRAKKIAVQQKEDALATAKQTLADRYIRAPFSGVVAKVSAKKGDSGSSGTAIATIITKQRLAEISLNEVDIVKVKVGQKVTLTFDAVENFSITGEVAEVDSIGTVTQGVVTYNVKIAFDTQDERIKPGMSLSAAVITDVKQNTLLVPNSAVKQQGDMAYVEIVDGDLSSVANVAGIELASPPRRQTVEIGLSNDTITEIINGLKESDRVVTQTITPAVSASQPQQNTGIRIPGLTGSGGGGFQGGGGRQPGR